MTNEQTTAEIKSASELLTSDELYIPDYQRPYKWTEKNVRALLEDIRDAILHSRSCDDKDYRYRIGSVILHKKSEGAGGQYDVVDGQQRLTTLGLLWMALGMNSNNLKLYIKKKDPITMQNLRENRAAIEDWLDTLNKSSRRYSVSVKDIEEAFENVLEFVVFTVTDIETAFQLFESQNARGKDLYPHDLLKAYHLRAMSRNGDSHYEKIRVAKRWEDRESADKKALQDLFEHYLFPIYKWTRREDVYEGKTNNEPCFGKDDIDVFKGVALDCRYTYAVRARQASQFFQANEPFADGRDFFLMVEHYLDLADDVSRELEEWLSTSPVSGMEVEPILEDTPKLKGLFTCALFGFLDRFGTDEAYSTAKDAVITKLFLWAFLARIANGQIRVRKLDSLALGTAGAYGINWIGGRGHGSVQAPDMIPLIYRETAPQKIANLYIGIKSEWLDDIDIEINDGPKAYDKHARETLRDVFNSMMGADSKGGSDDR